MTDPKAKSIPLWQHEDAPQKAASAQTDSNKSIHLEGGQPERKKKLLEQGLQWLEHEDIRNASADKKISYLEGKGLTKEEIHELLEAASEANSLEDPKTKEAVQPGGSQLPSPQHPVSRRLPSETYQPAESSPVPPIITYPEFLIHSHHPPPLITRSRVLSAVYISSVAGASLYGASRFLLNPMLDSLNMARHSFFETTSASLDLLNEKLEGIVSTIPSTIEKATHRAFGLASDHDDDDDLESDVSDPTELFHRDTGTQTSPPVSHSSSSASLICSDRSSTTPLSTQAAALKIMGANLSTILTSSNSAVDEDEVTLLSIGDLRESLLDITYGRTARPSHGDNSKINTDDEISRIKAEIRGVKGVLLSAKSFPGTGTGRTKAAGP